MSGVVAANMPQSDMLKTHNSESPDVNQEDETDRPIAPSATPAASRGTEQPRPGTTVCQNCLTTTTPLWRRDENGQILCNACGLFFKLHGRRRPISLKTDVIKSRNRSRNTSLGRRSHPKRPRVASSPRPSSPDKQRSASAERQQYPAAAAQPSPVLSMARGPNSAPPAVAPQPSPQQQPHVPPVVPSPYGFDPSQQQPTPVRTPQGAFPLPSISRSPGLDPSPPNIQLVRGSMSELLLPRSPPEGLERVPPLQHINATDLHEKATLPGIRPAEPVRNPEEVNKELTTRVSELELVNDLLKRRIADLEFSENQARRTAMEAQQTSENLWKQLTALKAEKNDA